MKDKIIEGFNNDEGYIKNNDFKIINLNDKECTMEYTVKKESLNPIKIVHGGVLFGLADSAAGILSCMSGKFPVTINSSIHYLNPAKCKKLIAKSKILKEGNSVGYYQVDIFDENDTILCTCNIDMYLKKIEQ